MFKKRMNRKAAMRLVDAFNAHDGDAVAGAVTADCIFIDSSGDQIEGRENCRGATEAFAEIEPDFALDISQTTVVGDEVLMRGTTIADNPQIARDHMWRARIVDGKVAEWQSFSDGHPASLANFLRSRLPQLNETVS